MKASTANAEKSVKDNQKTIDKVASEFSNFLADIEDLVTASTSVTGEDLTKIKDKINDRIAAAKASVELAGATVSDRAKKTATAADDYAHENPWQVIAGSALIGCVVGFLLARRS